MRIACIALVLTASLLGCGLEQSSRRPGAPGVDRGLVMIDHGISLIDGGVPRPDGSTPQVDQGVTPKVDGFVPKPDQFVPKVDSFVPKPDQFVPPSGDYDYKQHITLVTIPTTSSGCNAAQYGTFYCDVMTHTQSPYLSADTLTNVHETQHFMAHERDGSTAAADKFIYLRNGQGAHFPEPQLKTQDIVSSIQHQGTTYNTYIASRPTQPIGENIVDEWRAYLTEEIAAIQIAKIKGQGAGSVSGLVLGGVEFMYYNAAALHALSTKEPGFLTAQPQAVAIFAMLAEEMKTWTVDQGITPGLFIQFTNDKAKALLNDLRTASKNAGIRSTLKSLYGSVWTQRVLGFQ